MKRFYGAAVFEDEEVADSAYTQLQDIRAEEQRRLDAYEIEFKMQIDELNYWRNDEINTTNSNAYSQINEQYSLIAQYKQQIAQITTGSYYQIAQLNADISHCYHEIGQIEFDRTRLIAQVHADYAIEYNIQLTRRDKDIAWAHSDATARIAAVIARRYYVPVFMLRCAKGPCDFCQGKYGTTGTRDELEKLACIPPFHDDCRCWLEEVGYVVMTR